MIKNYIKKIFKLTKNESGLVIVEASIVFPIMFIVLFTLIYMGNAYYLKSQIESIVVSHAVSGANFCEDPLLETLKLENSIPEVKDLDSEPYRYIFGGMAEIEDKISGEVIEKFDEAGLSFFNNMKPELTSTKSEIASFNNYVVYSTFSVDLEATVVMPIKMFGEEDFKIITYKSRAEVPVTDVTEFIRNTDMVIDMISGTKLGDTISGLFGKVNEFINQFANS